MVERTFEVLVQHDRDINCLSKAAIGKSSTVSVEILLWRGLMREPGH
ncbi:hypothetical protein [Rhizobium sp. SG570]|jgi:hypothetical protein|nr:hypothetical protein [Rhizobium sp. SG570]NKJ39468.1 hypothetical protein [Rhizobium sp. SG570]NRP88523.1 hypothetical protein [Ensifer adhaerens]